MRIHLRSIIDAGRLVMELVQFAVAPESAAKRWLHQPTGASVTEARREQR